jgi:hypothetical protein
MSQYRRIGAFVEITPGTDGSIPESLLALAYGASESAFVVLAHSGVSARAIDRFLDRIVPRYGVRANGVIYADASDAAGAIDLARQARVVIAATPALQAALTEAGIAFVSESEASDVLGAPCRGGWSSSTQAVPMSDSNPSRVRAVS